eukprot:m.53480 g.53480  ORF g.53480 m.53480 type:complete len:55 (-) comp21768_c0_seq1:1647-1811(-)
MIIKTIHHDRTGGITTTVGGVEEMVMVMVLVKARKQRIQNSKGSTNGMHFARGR